MSDADEGKFLVRPWTFKSWKRHAEAIVALSGTPPDIDCRSNVVWLVDITDEETRREIRGEFEEYLFTIGNSRLGRFTALLFYYQFREPIDEYLEAADSEEITAAMDADFRYFADLPPSPAQLTDVASLRWEYRQAWVGRYWQRLVQICDRILQLQSQDHLHLNLELARVLWAGVARPRLSLSLAFSEPGIAHSGWLRPFAGSRVVDSMDREWLRVAATRIRNGLDSGKGVRPFYRAILADCCADSGEFLQASRIWEEHGGDIMRDICSEFTEFARNEGHVISPGKIADFQIVERTLFIAECLDKAGGVGDREQAINFLNSLLDAHRDSAAIHRKLTEILARENRYEEAISHVAAQRRLTPDDDVWKDTFADLAWHAAYLKPPATKDAHLNSVGAGLQKGLLRRATSAHWNTFTHLARECQEKWINGCYWLFAQLDENEWPDQHRASYAATDLSLAVEWQLRKHLFLPFKSQADERTVQLAQSNRDARLSPWSLFLLSEHELTLGAMQTVLKMANGASSPLLKPFENWLEQTANGYWKGLFSDKWREIAGLRNRNLHVASIELSDAMKLLRLCREFLDILLRSNSAERASRPSPGRPQ